MGLGHKGPIGMRNLAKFCIATTFRLFDSPKYSKRVTSCKICGVKTQAHHGRAVSIVGRTQTQRVNAYLCTDCYGYIECIVYDEGRFDCLPLEMSEPWSEARAEMAFKALNDETEH